MLMLKGKVNYCESEFIFYLVPYSGSPLPSHKKAEEIFSSAFSCHDVNQTIKADLEIWQVVLINH